MDLWVDIVGRKWDSSEVGLGRHEFTRQCGRLMQGKRSLDWVVIRERVLYSQVALRAAPYPASISPARIMCSGKLCAMPRQLLLSDLGSYRYIHEESRCEKTSAATPSTGHEDITRQNICNGSCKPACEFGTNSVCSNPNCRIKHYLIYYGSNTRVTQVCLRKSSGKRDVARVTCNP